MRLRRNGKKPAPLDPYRFHLVDSKSSPGTVGTVVGAIVTGPVSGLFDDVAGSAFQGQKKSLAQGSTPKKSAAKSGPKKKKASTKTRRRRAR
ncbi:MAG: hypothetical protein ABIZ04_23340 [Opitutus sp.]